MSGWLTEPAPAKVNLSLLVTGRRADGYHLLDSIVVFGPACDWVAAEPAPHFTLGVEGPFAAGLDPGGDNLVLRAAAALARHCGRTDGAALTLTKNLPVASGIGGGSADAAATLRLLCRLWGVTVAPPALHALARDLGADVPVCLDSRPARMTGIGEVVTPLPPLPALGLLLVNPGVAVSTADIFRARSAAFSPPAPSPAWSGLPDFAAAVAALHNDLEAPALGIAPVIGDVLAALRALPGCMLARMSGSGATCFALFSTPGAAEAASAAMPAAWWKFAGPLYDKLAHTVSERADDWGVAKR